MISFDINALLLSGTWAITYGFLFSWIIATFSILIRIFKLLPKILYQICKFNKLWQPIRIDIMISDGISLGAVFYFFAVICFALGFVLISYISLDGTLRVYMVVLTLLAFYLSNTLFSVFIEKGLFTVFNLLFSIIAYAARLFIFPFKHLIIRKK